MIVNDFLEKIIQQIFQCTRSPSLRGPAITASFWPTCHGHSSCYSHGAMSLLPLGQDGGDSDGKIPGEDRGFLKSWTKLVGFSWVFIRRLGNFWPMSKYPKFRIFPGFIMVTSDILGYLGIFGMIHEVKHMAISHLNHPQLGFLGS